MDNYKIFRTFEEDHGEVLAVRRLKSGEKDDYYRLVMEESLKGNQQLILTDEIILGVTLKYLLNEKYDLVDVLTSSPELNERLSMYIDKSKEDRGYIVAVMLELKKHEYRYEYITSLTISKFDEIITFHGNGVIATNVLLNEKLLDIVTRNYLGHSN